MLTIPLLTGQAILTPSPILTAVVVNSEFLSYCLPPLILMTRNALVFSVSRRKLWMNFFTSRLSLLLFENCSPRINTLPSDLISTIRRLRALMVFVVASDLMWFTLVTPLWRRASLASATSSGFVSPLLLIVTEILLCSVLFSALL